MWKKEDKGSYTRWVSVRHRLKSDRHCEDHVLDRITINRATIASSHWAVPQEIKKKRQAELERHGERTHPHGALSIDPKLHQGVSASVAELDGPALSSTSLECRWREIGPVQIGIKSAISAID